jgi:hypothetical protein
MREKGATAALRIDLPKSQLSARVVSSPVFLTAPASERVGRQKNVKNDWPTLEGRFP